MSNLCNRAEHLISRRRLLGGAAAGLGYSALGSGTFWSGALGAFAQPAVAEELKSGEKQVLMVWLDGGMSQLESWDPKPNTEFGGPFRSIATSVPGTHISELMPHTAKQMHQIAVLRSVSTKDNAHSSGVARIQRGDPKNRGVAYPMFGSAVAKLLGPCQSGLPPYVWVKPGSGGFKAEDGGFLGAKYGSLALGDAKPPENLLAHPSISAADNVARNELRKKLNARYAKGRSPENSEANSYAYDVADQLMKRADLFDDSKLTERDKDRYGTHELGRHMLMGRKLLEAGVRFVKVNSYHWDSHGDHFHACDSLIPQFDRPFAALIEDLAERGMLDNVLVIVLSEFGRTPRINSHVGRDHWPEAWSVGMAGCGIKRGVVVGKTNALGTDVDGPPHDIGHLFHTWFSALGVGKAQMQYDNHGQPLPVAHEECAPVAELLA